MDQKEDARICPVCGAIYVVVRADNPTKAYGFGHIECRSCGMFTEV
ncbi:conserved hypothetical protein [delta proteobacterium NaphS2]|nr:conserved hypothetical protein [delta proteobacterium NaphS2]